MTVNHSLHRLGDARIILIEGVSGVGKTSYRKHLEKKYAELGKEFFVFHEEELLFSYKHVAISGIEDVRFDLYDKLLLELDMILRDDLRVVVLERSHFSAKVVSWNWNRSLDTRFLQLSDELARRSAHVCLLTLSEEQFAKRHGHDDRGAQWADYLEKKKVRFGVADLSSRVREEQREFLELVQNSVIPHSIIPAHSFPLA